MATPRVTEVEVLAIMDNDLTDADVTPFITAANLVVTDRLTGQHDAALLKEIERWLAAHLVSTLPNAGVARRERLGDAVIEYEAGMASGATSTEGLRATRYGRQVLLLDSSGILASGTGKRRAYFKAIDFSLE